jgi:UDP-glucuronate 4-epimerase
MKILVTGCAGFIGSHLVRSLLDNGQQVIGLDSFNNYYNSKIKRYNCSLFANEKKFRLFECDICDYQSLNNIFKEEKPEIIAHLAGLAGVRNSVSDPNKYFQVNVNGSLNLLELSAKNELVKNFVFASTSSIYGDTASIPFLETDPCLMPPQPYAASKRSVELLGYTYNKLYKLPFTALRFFTVYGPSGRPDMMPFLLAESISKKIAVPFYGDKMSRDWTFVSDIVKGIKLALFKPLGYEIINLGRGEPVSLTDFIEIMENCAGSKAILDLQPKPEADVFSTFANIDKANKLLGYLPQISVKEGVSTFWKWYQEVFLPQFS